MRIYGGWSFRRAGADYGWLLAIAVSLLAVVLVYARAPTLIGAPLPATTNIVPTTGEQGYPVAELCKDTATTVSGPGISPPDSKFAATYQLARTKAGVHEVVIVNVYGDQALQPVGTHYDAVNTPTDANVTKAAMDCIRSKAK